MESVEQQIFPFDSFLNDQHLVLTEALDALWGDGYKNIIIDGPVGTGKSGINTALLNHADTGFYTTPVKSLREQLENDAVLQDHLYPLKARRDYYCSVGGTDCDSCSVYNSDDQSCSNMGSKCTYWANKMAAIGHDSPVLTFSYLIIDGLLPEEGPEGQPISFGHRDIIVVDEAQNLIEQVRSLHAGADLTPYAIPTGIFETFEKKIDYRVSNVNEIEGALKSLKAACGAFVDGIAPQDMTDEHKKCKRVAGKLDWILREVKNGNPHVVNVDNTFYEGQQWKKIEITPIYVDKFLSNFIWNRANKRVISTATLPYRGNEAAWIRSVGLDPDETKIISVSMPFPVENRPIYTSTIVGSMSNSGYQNHKEDVLATLNNISGMHYNEKGIIHTGSYSRAQDLAESVDSDQHIYLEDNIFVDEKDRETDVVISEWQQSDHDMLASPNIMEGIDLKDDMGRFNVLLKVPYKSIDTPTEYILENMDWGWSWYNERALIRCVQSYGRTVRSETDYANFYVLDKDFEKLIKRRNPPEWFSVAITDEEPEERSVFDY